MVEITFESVGVVILALAGAISAIGGAVKMIVDGVKAVKAPNKNQDNRLDAAEKDIKDIRVILDKDKKRLDNLDDGNRVTQRALIALLGHGLDGNNQKQMQAAKEELESYLINR